jgi:hypothetical protein
MKNPFKRANHKGNKKNQILKPQKSQEGYQTRKGKEHQKEHTA